MVYQVSAGYSVLGRMIKVPQTFIARVMRGQIFIKTSRLTDQLMTFHVAVPSGPVTSVHCQAFGNILDLWAATDLLPLIPVAHNYVGVHVRSMEGLSVPKYTTVANTGPGSMTGEELPYEVSIPVLLETGITGHGSHGLSHFPSPTENVNNNGAQPTAAYLTSVSGAMSDLITNIDAADLTLVIASYKFVTIKAVSAYQVRNFWGTVNSRKLEHGR